MNIKDLKPGDKIVNKGSGKVYVVTATYGDRATAVNTVDVTNPSEWKKINFKK